jgi:hypothetical protein
MSKTILAGVLALFLGPGATMTASAEPSAPVGSERGVIHLFGRTLCLAAAPVEARCDWRAPAPEPADDGLALTLFGTRYCLGAATACDRGARAQDGTFRLLGMTWCTTSEAGCDVVLPANRSDASPARDMHASR